MENTLLPRLVKYGAAIQELSELLGQSIEMKAIRSQIIRSATSVGANYHESQSASSRQDYINKVQISLKELKETLYWLGFIQTSYAKKLRQEETVNLLIDESDQLVKILNSCVLTAKQNLKKLKEANEK